MASPFPDLPRADCPFVPTVNALSSCPMVPKPLWTGAASYCDPAYPHGGGPDDVPAAPPSMGQATPATISPPAQTSMGGSGGGGTDPELYMFKNGGSTTVVLDNIMKISGCSGWAPAEAAYLLELNDVPCNLLAFICVSESVAPGSTGYCYCLNGRIYISNKVAYEFGPVMPGSAIGAGWSTNSGSLIPNAVGFRVVALDENNLVHFARDMMPSQLLRITSNAGSVVNLQTVVDSTGQLGGVIIPATRTDF